MFLKLLMIYKKSLNPIYKKLITHKLKENDLIYYIIDIFIQNY